MVQDAPVIVESEQERSHDARFLGVTKSADDTIGGAPRLDFHHGGPLAGGIRLVESLRDDAVEGFPHGTKPFLRGRKLCRRRRQANGAASRKILRRKYLQ